MSIRLLQEGRESGGFLRNPPVLHVAFRLKRNTIDMADWSRVLRRGNVVDRRGSRLVGGGLSIGGIALLLLVNYLAGGSLSDVVYQLPRALAPVQEERYTSQYEGNDAYEQFAAAVLGSTDEVWSGIFERMDLSYTEPRLVLFRDATESGCGIADARVGPHYCPLDQTIYLDETFFEELTNRFGAQGGDVAQAYVLAHEVGHHVQNLRGTLEGNGTQSAAIATELQADCYAGVWAGSIANAAIFAPGEIAEAMDAAAAVGDDRIQLAIEGRVTPENWTHGSSKDRVAAFTRGFDTANPAACSQ